jgi:hypothetical protein
MSTNLRLGNLLAILFAGCGLIACTSTAATPSGTGGSTGAGGSGTGTGGSGTGSGGNTGSGGAAGYALSSGVLCFPPAASGLITNFTYAPGEAGTTPTDQVHFGDDATTLSGGEFIYPAGTTAMYPLTSSVLNSNWHITGTVGDFSGFGFFFETVLAGTTTTTACNHVDATGFKGISFDISGTVMGSSLTFEVDTLKDTIAASWLNTHLATGQTAVDPSTPGDCIPAASATNQYNQSDCTPATKAIAIGSTPTTVTVLWTDFTTGKPQASVTASDIIGIRWVLPTPASPGTAAATTYPLDLTVDNISFIPQ